MDELPIRPARPTDIARIAAIYNQGIEDRVATFETASRSAQDVGAWKDCMLVERLMGEAK